MEIAYTEDTLLSEINTEFQRHYPYLKIQFYEGKIERFTGKEVAGEPVKNYEMSIHDLIHGRVKGCISIHGNQKVRTFENHWRDESGIWAQVFRKSGSIWLQTTVTDEMTLSEINALGEEMNRKVEKPENEDYHEQL